MRVVLIAFITSLLLLSGCGQKGPLYLPQDQATGAPSSNGKDDNKNALNKDKAGD